jgi:phage-related minor tail protein
MADKRIKGITIELNGDTGPLDRALKGVEKEAFSIAAELKNVENALKFNPGNAELVAQQQELLGKQIEATAKKLDTLRQAQSQVERQFQSGAISPEQYRAFQRELISTESALDGLQGKLQRVQADQQSLESATRQLQTLFDATGTNIDQYADRLGPGLTNAIRSGRASLQQMERAINEVGRAALGADADMGRMTNALRSADSGNSLNNIRRELSEVADEARSAGNEVNEFGSNLTSVVSGLAAGAGIGAVVSKALDASSLMTKIEVSFDVPEESKQSVYAAVRGIEAYGLDGQEALEGVRRQWALNKTASDDANASIVKQAAGIAAAYQGIDFIELIQETNEVAAALEVSNEDALALTNALLKAGFPPEQLDTIAEYGKQMSDAGFSAKEIQSIFEAGIDTKTWNIDNLNDGVKEVRIQMATFGQEIPSALAPLLDQAGMSQKTFQDWGKAVAAGGDQGSKALSDMVTWLDTIENEALKNEIATKVFGTKWEDQGQNMISVFQGVGSAMDKTEENAALLNNQMESLNSDPAVQMQQAIADMNTALAPLLTSIAELIGKIASWASENPALASTLLAIGTTLGIIITAVIALTPLIVALTGVTGGFGVALSGAILPITLIVAAIAALIAIGVLLYKNWDEIVAFCKKAWSAIVDTMKAYLEMAKKNISAAIDFFKSTFENGLSFLKALVSGDFEGMKNAIGKQMEAAKTLVNNILNNIKEFFRTILGDSYNTVAEKFTSIVDSVRNKMQSVLDTIKSLWNSAVEFLKSIDLKEIGANIIQGLLNGLESMKAKVVNTAKNIASGIGDSVKDFFDIHSPSRLMLWYGANIVQGLANGMSNTARQAINSAAAVSSAVAGAMAIDASGMVAAATAGSSSASAPAAPSIVLNFADMLRGGNFVIRNDNDGALLAQQFANMVTQKFRGIGG